MITCVRLATILDWSERLSGISSSHPNTILRGVGPRDLR
jgi:hypothetical protein